MKSLNLICKKVNSCCDPEDGDDQSETDKLIARDEKLSIAIDVNYEMYVRSTIGSFLWNRRVYRDVKASPAKELVGQLDDMEVELSSKVKRDLLAKTLDSRRTCIESEITDFKSQYGKNRSTYGQKIGYLISLSIGLLMIVATFGEPLALYFRNDQGDREKISAAFESYKTFVTLAGAALLAYISGRFLTAADNINAGSESISQVSARAEQLTREIREKRIGR